MEGEIKENKKLSAKDKFKMIRDTHYMPVYVKQDSFGSRYEETVALAFKKSTVYKILGVILFIVFLWFLTLSNGLSTEKAVILIIALISILIQRIIRKGIVMDRTSVEEIQKINNHTQNKLDGSNKLNIDINSKNILKIIIIFSIVIISIFILSNIF